MITLHNNGTNLLNYKIGVSWKFTDQFVVKFFMSFEHTSIIKLLRMKFLLNMENYFLTLENY